jgi:cell fate regulator YaaT (PSP1 superfamily)
MKAIKVQFKELGKKYFFSQGKYKVKYNDYVVVNTIRGLELGRVVDEEKEVDPHLLVSELKDIVRIASQRDLDNYNSNRALEAKIMQKTKEFSKKCKLDIKILGAEYTLDKSKLLIYFESEQRVDFRELVKMLAETYKTRIELRQVGSRDGAKVFGGLGPCGLVVCCKTFLTEFSNVSIKMAKNQSLSLNPQKISGACGKLLCCINYENDQYTELRKNAPDVGDIIYTEDGDAKVLTSDVLNRVCKVKYFDTEGFGFLSFDEIKGIKKAKYKKEMEIDEASLRSLE